MFQHHAICQGPSELFYNRVLRADKSILKRNPLTPMMNRFWPGAPDHPVVLCDTIGEESYDETGNSETDIHSKCNNQEANVIVCVCTIIAAIV